jgi:cellulose synthase/poly-beta-1,6-N-acetylglucosamine synthase-like glycosyltransferase
MEDEMKLSFIVVAYNNPKALRTCLSSLVDQTYSPEEIEIIVCDNSQNFVLADENKRLCDMSHRIRYEYTGNRTAIDLPHIRHKHCLYTATEIGVGLATGEWISFPNQDSYYAPVFAERMLTVADAEYTEFVYSDVVLGGPGHGYFVLVTAPRNCGIDKTCFMLRREWFQGFKSKHDNYELADGFFVEELVTRGIKHSKCCELLVVHN